MWHMVSKVLLVALCLHMQPAQSQCFDANRECIGWARRGDCDHNPITVRRICPCACALDTQLLELRGQAQPGSSPQRSVNDVFDDDTQEAAESSFDYRQETNIQLVDTICDREDVRDREQIGALDVRRRRDDCVDLLDNGGVDCERSANACFYRHFRTLDALCNNMRQPMLGAAFTQHKRLLQPHYDDGFGQLSAQGRPPARAVSRLLLSSSAEHLTDNSALLMPFGQFLAHDITRTTLMEDTDCRDACRLPKPQCASLDTSSSDEFNSVIRGRGCLPIPRTSPVCGSLERQRALYNQNTAYVDGSAIYTSSWLDLPSVRDRRFPFLLATINTRLGEFPPRDFFNDNFFLGDERGNIFVGILSLHVLFMREHNRIARQLRVLNERWSDDRVFQEARKIVGAEMQVTMENIRIMATQVITYREFLPALFGDAAYERWIGEYQGYNDSVDPTISDAFSSAAFRMGHGMIQEFYPRINRDFLPVPAGPLRIDSAILRPLSVLNDGVDSLMRGMMTMNVKAPSQLHPAITERLFGNHDLSTINIQRGRDVGLPPFNEWRQLCGLPEVTSWKQLIQDDDRRVKQLRALYGSTERLDLYVGGVLERPANDSMLGDTYACLIGEQFKRLRAADRFWYEHAGVFSERQRDQLGNMTLSRILCDNGNDFDAVPRKSFQQIPDKSGMTPCSEMPALDLRAWQEA